MKILRCHMLCCTLAIFCSMKVRATKEEGKIQGKNRAGKLFSVFQIVTFPNAICMGGMKNGTCYTSAECTNKGGVNAGSCAQGYGVCCTISLSCGGTSNQNCTYIESTNIPAGGACRNTICPCNNNICQLRLDFTSFVIAGPATSTLTAPASTSILNGGIVTALGNGVPNSFSSRCLTDSFTVTNTGGTDPPVICGNNNGQHMYADVDQSGNKGCNDLVFQLGMNGVSTAIPTRMWSIKVTQYACDSLLLAPPGCTQYFLDPTGIVQTYNFMGGQHLAFQRETFCVRRGKGNCRICWIATSLTDFAVSGKKVGAAGSAISSSIFCCGLGTANGKNTKGYDCLQIPGALNFAITTISKAMLKFSRFCGRSFGIPTAAAAGANKSVCSTVVPFYIRFISDGTESLISTTAANAAMSEATNLNKGFQLAYTQDSKCKQP